MHEEYSKYSSDKLCASMEGKKGRRLYTYIEVQREVGVCRASARKHHRNRIIEDRLASCGQSSLQHQIKMSAHRLIMVTLRPFEPHDALKGGYTQSGLVEVSVKEDINIGSDAVFHGGAAVFKLKCIQRCHKLINCILAIL